jgi:hypothetical protein
MVDPTSFGDFPKADPVERGCGDREPGGVYCESGLSPHGRPLEDFLIDPPLPIPDGLDLVNKPQLWQRMSTTGEPILDAQDHPIFDLLIWVGAEHYEYCPDFVEEVERYGASRRLNPNLDLSLLSAASRMILAHPKVINTAWLEQQMPQECGKHIQGHARSDAVAEPEGHEDERDEDESDEDVEPSPCGPCLYKLWELIPIDAAQTVIDQQGESPLCLRAVGSTTYSYRPTGETVEGLTPGLFAALPITGFALIQFADGSVNEKAKQNILAGLEAHGPHALPFYESER